MTKTALISLFALAAVPLFAREEALSDSTSPDKHYRVVVAEDAGRISYHIKATSDATTLLALPSSFQPDSGSDGWGFHQSLGATINWRKDSRCVAIDEANHGRIGTVVIARRTPKGFQQVAISREALMRASKQPWERGRLFFDAWGRRDTLVLGLLGLVRRVPDGPRDEFGVSFTLDLSNKGKIIAIEPDKNATK